MDSIIARADKSLSILRTNEYLSAFVTLLLILYAGLAAPALPPIIAELFEYSSVKIALLTLMLILLRGQNVGLALLFAVGFVVSMNTLSHYRMFGMVHELATETMATVAPMSKPYAEVTPGPISTVDWESDGDKHKVLLRGEVHEFKDVKNLLPGGHN
jgi:hypothetical protein